MHRAILGLVIALITLSVGCGPSGSSPATITIKGSDTMVNLVAAWAEGFMKVEPGIEVSVTGGGTGTGIASFLNKTADICAASRDMTDTEKRQADHVGLRFQETAVARDGIAVIVHPSNPVSELTLEQLRKIYTGALTKWSEVGGGEGEFIVLSRETNSGTFIFFQEHVLNKLDYTPKARLMAATSALIQSVSVDVHAIAYVGLGYALEARDRVKMLRVKAGDNAPSIEPSEETVLNGTYSISRPLYFYTSDAPAAGVQQFIQYCLSEEGQKAVRDAGFVPVN